MVKHISDAILCPQFLTWSKLFYCFQLENYFKTFSRVVLFQHVKKKRLEKNTVNNAFEIEVICKIFETEKKKSQKSSIFEIPIALNLVFKLRRKKVTI